MLATARQVAAWPGAVGLVPAMPAVGLAAIAIGGMWLCIWRRRWRYWGLLGIIAGLLSVPLAPVPNILVSGDGRLMAVRMADGALALSSTRRAKRVGRVWLNRAGQLAPQSRRAHRRLSADPIATLTASPLEATAVEQPESVVLLQPLSQLRPEIVSRRMTQQHFATLSAVVRGLLGAIGFAHAPARRVKI